MTGRILVLDDEENYARMLQDLLRSNGFWVDMATRPERAVSQLEEIPYNLVISDYKMPVMDGADFLKEARAIYPELPFILVSGLMNTPDLVKAANMQVTLVLEKPLNVSKFIESVTKFVQPMSGTEKQSYRVGERRSESQYGYSRFVYPSTPRFFSADCSESREFMHNAWKICEFGTQLFLFHPKGGDADLAVLDLSEWRENEDKIVNKWTFKEFIEGGIGLITDSMSNEEHSNVFSIQLDSADQIKEASAVACRIVDGLDSLSAPLFIFKVEFESHTEALQKHLSEPNTVLLPSMNYRSPDIAHYFKRYVRSTAERLGKLNCLKFSDELAYHLISYGWPGNHKELQEFAVQLVSESEDAALEISSLEQLTGPRMSKAEHSTASRLRRLLEGQQKQYILDCIREAGGDLDKVISDLQLDPNLKREEDLDEIPLLQPELAKL